MSHVLNDPQVQRVLEASKSIPCAPSRVGFSYDNVGESYGGVSMGGMSGGGAQQSYFASSEQYSPESSGFAQEGLMAMGSSSNLIGGFEGSHQSAASSDLVSHSAIDEFSSAGYNAEYGGGGGISMGSSAASFESGISSGGAGFVGGMESSSFGAGGYDDSYGGGAMIGGGGGAMIGGGGGMDQSSFAHHSSSQFSNYRIQQDHNPIVVRRPYNAGPSVYRQNIQVRFLRPPQLPPPGPLIIREIRPPQQPPAPPLVIRQRPPRPATPPPLILRERPPRPPVLIGSKVVVKRLPPIPPPPRQVIIERYPPLPPKPRDIIIERWLPYGPMPKRRVIYQRAAAVAQYRTAKNMIVCYESSRPRVERVFRRLGVSFMNPIEYSQRYGISLLDAQTLVSHARSQGVIEDISAHAMTGFAAGAIAAGAIAAGSGGYEASSASFESSGYGLGAEDVGASGFGASYGVEGATAEYSAGVSGFASDAMESRGGMAVVSSELYGAEDASAASAGHSSSIQYEGGSSGGATYSSAEMGAAAGASGGIQQSSYDYHASSSEIV